MARRFNEKDHPRHPRGSGDGGQFREKGSVPTPRKPKAGDSDFNKRQKKRAAAKKTAPAKKAAAPKKAPAKKATPPKKAAPAKRVMLEQSADLSDLPEEQRPAYMAVLRAAATHGVHKTGDRDRDRMIDNLVTEGFLVPIGQRSFGVTEKGFGMTGERKAFGQHAWAERIDADIQAKRIEMDPGTYGDEDDENFRDSISWGSRVEELLADEGLHGEIDPNDRVDHPDPDEYAQWLIDNGMTQSLSDMFPDEDFAAGPTPEDLAGQARQTERRNYFNALIEEARSFAEADEEEGDESPELRGQIAILERAMRTGTKEEMDAAASHLRRMLTISYADEDEMPEIPPSVQYRPSV